MKSSKSIVLALSLIGAGLLIDCTASAVDGPTPIETAVRKAFKSIDAANAHTLYPLIRQEERVNEKLTENQLGGLLRILKRGIKGATPGPVVLNGDENAVTGLVFYKKEGKLISRIALYCRRDQDGTIGARGLTWSLLMSAADIEGNPTRKVLTNRLDAMKANLKGIQDIRKELKSDGPNRILGPTGVLTFDELIAGKQSQILRLESKSGTRQIG